MKTLTTSAYAYAFEVGQKVRYKPLLGTKLIEGYIVRFVNDDVALVRDRRGRRSKQKLKNLMADASTSLGEAYKPLTMPWSKHLLQKIAVHRVDPFLCEAIWTYVNHKVWPRKMVLPTIQVTNLPGYIKGYWSVQPHATGGGIMMIDEANRYGLNGLASIVAHEQCHQYQTFTGLEASHANVFDRCASLVKQKTGISVYARADEGSDDEFEMGLHPIYSDRTLYYLFVYDSQGLHAGSTTSGNRAADAFSRFSALDPAYQVYVFKMTDLALRKLCANLDEQRDGYELSAAVQVMLDYARQHGRLWLNSQHKKGP